MMDEIIDEGKIEGAIDALNLAKTDKIIQQMKTCICKVYGQKIGTGFFCKINYQNKTIPVLMTNYHILSDEYLEKNKFAKISINDEQIFEVINVEEKSILFSSKDDKYDIMIIKINEENAKFNYLELDNNLFNANSEYLYENKSIYILHYPNGENISVSYGYGIKKLDKYYITHLCSTEFCSSGSPILNLSSNKVIGIHKGKINNKDKKAKYNIGILLKYPLNEIKVKETNEIKIKINTKDKDVNKKIILFDNSKIELENSYKLKSYDENLKEPNKNNSNQSICKNCKSPLDNTYLPLCQNCFKNEILNEAYSSYLEYLNDPKVDFINAYFTITNSKNEKKPLTLDDALALYNYIFPNQKFGRKQIILELKKRLCIACLNDMKASIFSFYELPCKCRICCLTHLNKYLSFFNDYKRGFYCRCKTYYAKHMMRELILIEGLNKDIYERIKLYFQMKLDSICCICIKTKDIRDYSHSLISRDKPEYNQFLQSLKHYLCNNCFAVNKNKKFFCQICQMNHFLN